MSEVCDRLVDPQALRVWLVPCHDCRHHQLFSLIALFIRQEVQPPLQHHHGIDVSLHLPLHLPSQDQHPPSQHQHLPHQHLPSSLHLPSQHQHEYLNLVWVPERLHQNLRLDLDHSGASPGSSPGSRYSSLAGGRNLCFFAWISITPLDLRLDLRLHLRLDLRLNLRSKRHCSRPFSTVDEQVFRKFWSKSLEQVRYLPH